jgi:GT2 family glycosyltransferase
LTLSVAICTRNRPEALLRCVLSVVRQVLPPAELLVIDDGDLAPAQRAFIESRCQSGGIRFIYARKNVPGLPASRNRAVDLASGEILQFLDDDVELEPDFCRQIMRLYALDPGEAVVGIDGTLLDEPSPAARAFDLVYLLAGWWALPARATRRVPMPDPLRDQRWAVPVRLLSGACMSFRRSGLRSRRFDEGLNGYALGEDRDISLQLAGCGRLLRARGARAVHRHDPAGRPDAFQFGRMSVLNYTRIMSRAGRTRVGDHIIIGYTLTVLAAALGLASLLKPRRYAAEWLGVVSGLAGLLRRGFADSGLRTARPDATPAT